MAPGYGEVLFNPTAAWVNSVTLTGGYGTPAQIDYLGTLSYEYESDNDSIMSGGVEVETLSITKNGKGTFSEGALNMAAAVIMRGAAQTQTETGTTPNRYTTQDVLFGDAGLPYFGLIVAYAATNGANLLVGFPKVILVNPPGFAVEQNKFRIGETEFKIVMPSTTTRKAIRIRRFETATSIPTTQSAWDNWFSGMWS